eukprot:GFUD01022931.1.p1 GENE.GFUD01022931.1~~GFUD01022931.1.p1  ORF type:complete len:1136 (-),score=340.84 GFUD01022931.1:94-3501(-)
MHKRSSSQDDGNFGRRSGERDDRAWERGGRDDRRDGRNSRSVKKQRTDSSDAESHHDVEILYNRVHKGRNESDYDPRKYEDSASNLEGQSYFPPSQGPQRHQRGRGLLGDAPEPAQRHLNSESQRIGQFTSPPNPNSYPGKNCPRPRNHPQHSPGLPDYDQGGNSLDPRSLVGGHMISSAHQNSALDKPPITSLLLAMSGSSVGPSSLPPHISSQPVHRLHSTQRTQPMLSPESLPVAHQTLPSAKQLKDGFWNLPPLRNSPCSGSKQNNREGKSSAKKQDEDEPPWKYQMKELKDYILKLENEKKDLTINLETDKIKQLRDYIIKIEIEKQDLLDSVQDGKKGLGTRKENDGHMIEMIKNNIERVKQAQEMENKSIETKKVKLANESKRLEEEKRKLDNAKNDLKKSLDNGMTFLSTEKNKMELELQKKKQEKSSANETMLGRIKLLEVAVKNEKESRAKEEKRHLATELEELETRKEMTIKTIESETKVEELETKLEEVNSELYELKQKTAKKDSENRNLSSEVTKAAKQNDELVQKLNSTKSKLESELGKNNLEQQTLKNKFDAEYAVFSKKREEFDDTEKIRCVFCPQENLQTVSNFIFHIAREHMFDQYKSNDIREESLKVGMFLKVLEDKARKELALEMKVLNQSLEELKERAFKYEEVNEDKQVMVNELNDKTSALERDIETLLESEANNKNQIDNLVLRNNTLQNQMRNTSISETMRIENQEMGKKINVLGREVNDLKERRLTLEREVDGLRQRWKEESSEKMSWKTKCRELTSETDNLRKRLEEQENNRDNVKETLKDELNNANVEKDNLRQRIRNLEEKVDELVSHKAVAEAQFQETRAENEAMKEFRSDLSAINDVVCDDMRIENKTLKSKLSSAQNENKNLKSELSKAKTSKNFVLNELNLAKKEANSLKIEVSDVRNENLSSHQRLTEAMEKIQVFEKDMEDCLKEQKEFENDTSFTFGMGIDTILKAPLDVINLQIENIDIDQLDNIDIEDDASVEEVDDEATTEETKCKSDASVVLAAVEIQIGDTVVEESPIQYNIEEKKAGWSDDEFDYDLLNDSQEDEITEKNVKLISKPVPMSVSPHLAGCDCVDCDDCDVLHGYVSGEAQGIKEMMRQNSLTRLT